jgi:NAD(P)-dependent dehydrogenase (short-subunit alcohol dehydrogenase family)
MGGEQNQIGYARMKRLLVTGATSGIGEAVALLAAKNGYVVIACGRNKDKLAILEQQPNISTCQFDVTDLQATKTALAEVECDIVLLNAGTCEYVDVNAIDAAMFQRVFDANVFGVVNVIEALSPKLVAGNKLVFVDSLARLLPFARSQAYGASKAALHYMAKSFAVDFAAKGIQVQTISPGFVKTPLTDKNDFPMPMSIEVEEAAQDILNGLASRQASVYFPTRFSLLLRCLDALPEFIQHKLCLSMRQPPAAPVEQQKRDS